MSTESTEILNDEQVATIDTTVYNSQTKLQLERLNGNRGKSHASELLSAHYNEVCAPQPMGPRMSNYSNGLVVQLPEHQIYPGRLL